jgi:hypothetical protein
MSGSTNVLNLETGSPGPLVCLELALGTGDVKFGLQSLRISFDEFHRLSMVLQI